MNEKAKKRDAAKPLKVIREGAIAASIWCRQAPSGYEYFDFSISRSWKTQTSGKEGYSSNFFASNESQLTGVIAKAAAWIARQQTDTNPDVIGDETVTHEVA